MPIDIQRRNAQELRTAPVLGNLKLRLETSLPPDHRRFPVIVRIALPGLQEPLVDSHRAVPAYVHVTAFDGDVGGHVRSADSVGEFQGAVGLDVTLFPGALGGEVQVAEQGAVAAVLLDDGVDAVAEQDVGIFAGLG